MSSTPNSPQNWGDYRNVSLTARKQDLTIMGSAVEAGQDINLNATEGDVNITPGAESSTYYSKDKYSGIGFSHSSDPAGDLKSGSGSREQPTLA